VLGSASTAADMVTGPETVQMGIGATDASDAGRPDTFKENVWDRIFPVTLDLEVILGDLDQEAAVAEIGPKA